MFKELILAIIFGGLIGFGATGTFMALKKKPNIEIMQSTVTPSPQINQVIPTISTIKSTLTIFQPNNDAVVSDSKLTLKGQTDNSAIIIVTTPDNSYSVTADSSGNFDVDINLNPGINHLKITSISPTDSENNSELFVTYTTAKI